MGLVVGVRLRGLGLWACSGLTDADLRAHPAYHVAFLARMHVSRDSEAHAIAFCSAGKVWSSGA